MTSADSETASLRAELYKSFDDRTHTVLVIYKGLRTEIGEARAREIMRTALYDVGAAAADRMRAAFNGAPTPMQAVQAYERASPDGGRAYPLRYSCDESGCTVETLSCPIKSYMERISSTQEDFTAIAEILDGATQGLLEALGFTSQTILPRLGGDICCRIRIESPGSAAISAANGAA